MGNCDKETSDLHIPLCARVSNTQDVGKLGATDGHTAQAHSCWWLSCRARNVASICHTSDRRANASPQAMPRGKPRGPTLSRRHTPGLADTWPTGPSGHRPVPTPPGGPQFPPLALAQLDSPRQGFGRATFHIQNGFENPSRSNGNNGWFPCRLGGGGQRGCFGPLEGGKRRWLYRLAFLIFCGLYLIVFVIFLQGLNHNLKLPQGPSN